ncbi:TonB-dependent receptor domain-containing protein [Shewanella youngdeokensis]|uniref:TonB-dependent receptor n=1 Tax=Shewanella youngdeokensis TaxID=2999068 RepID=A0ABZ0JZG3_9GAMM|nr:TonB-dependent receptor [Shewanella sp. DAU334]
MSKAFSGRALSLVALAVSTGLSAGAFAEDQPTTATNEMEVMVVTANKSGVSLLKAPASMSVVTKEDIKLNTSVDVMDAVRQTPGITFQGRSTGGRQAMSIRGMDSDKTMFLVDGRRTLGSDNVFGHSNFQYNWLPMSAVESIEVVRGPLSALYGSDALGGVVNVRTKPIPEQWSGSVSARTGFAEGDGGDELNGSVHLAGPLSDNLGMLLSYTYSQADEVMEKENPSISELEDKESQNVFGRLSYLPSENHRLNVDFGLTDEVRFFNTASYLSTYDIDKSMYSVGYEGQFDNFDLNLGAYHAQMEQINSRTNGSTPSNPQLLKNSTVDASIGFDINPQHQMLVGTELRQETLEHPDIAGGKKDIQFLAAFAQDEWLLSDNLTATVGLRWDEHENFGSEISPRAYLVYTINDNWLMKGGYSHGFRAPTVKQSSPEYRFTSSTMKYEYMGNADVSPETSENYELNLTYSSNRASVAVTAYYNEIDDLIDSVCVSNCSGDADYTSDEPQLKTYENIEQAMTRGIETEIDVDLTEKWAFKVSYAYLDTENKTTGEELEQRPDQTVNSSVSWTDLDTGLSFRFRAEYLGEQLNSDVTMPGYTQYHAHGIWDASDSLSVNFGIKNLTDVDLAEESEEFDYAERGRTYYVGVNASF